MKKFLSLSFYLITIFYTTSILGAPESTSHPTEYIHNASSVDQEQQKFMLEQQREYIEQLITEMREETGKISFCLQQLTQALQAQKIKVTKEQNVAITKEIVEIQQFINMLLEKVFIQVTPDMIQLGFVLNNVISKYLLKTIETDITTINAEKLNNLIDRQFAKKIEQVSPETMQHLIHQNQKTITQLLEKADFIGLTWYNRGYRFLKQNNASSVVRATGVTALTVFLAACVYKTYAGNADISADVDAQPGMMQNILNKLGTPPKVERVAIPGPNGKLIEVEHKTDGTGILKFCDLYATGIKYGVIGSVPFWTPNWPGYFSKLYSQYWLKLKTEATKRWNQFDTILLGTDKKYDLGECERVFFQDMTGAEHLEELAKKITNYLLHPERYERAQIEEHRGILLHGPPQTGKTLFVKALRTMIADNFGPNKKISFIDAKKILDIDARATIDEIFDYAKHIAPCILFFDEIDLMGAHREKNSFNTGQLLTNMQGVDMVSKQVIVIGATNKLEQLDKALLVDGRFGKIIHIDYPNYHQRKSFLEQQLNKRNIQLDSVFIDYIAQETEGASYNKLKRLITESLISSTIALRPVVQADFEKTLDTEIRKITKPHTPMSPEEKRVIAIHQAGKALMRHLLQTKQEVVKITTLPVAKNVKANEYGLAIKTDNATSSDNDKFAESHKEQKMKDGEVFTKTSTSNAALLSDEESKKECLTLLAGNVAHKVMLNQSFTQCNPQDRAEAMKIIYSLISHGEKIDKDLRNKAVNIKETYEKEVEKILIAHKNILEKIVNQLMEQTNIDRYQWKELIKDCPVLS